MVVPSFLAFTLACAFALALTPAVRSLALRLGAVDHAVSSRKRHGRAVPRLGGLAIVLAMGLALPVALAAAPSLAEGLRAGWRQSLAALAGGLAIAALGAYDDLRGARPRHKLAVQLAAAGLVWWAGYRIEALPIPFGEPLALGPFGLPLTILWIVGVTNALNLADGLDGLVAGQSAIAMAAFLVLALHGGQPLLALVAAAAAGASLGFLRHNRPPASIFMGDTGSLVLGFTLAVSSVALGRAGAPGTPMLAPAVVLGLPVVDALLAFLRRLLRAFPVARGDRGHLHHRVLDLVPSQTSAVLLLWGGSLLVALAGLALAFASGPAVGWVLAALAVAGLVVLRGLGYLPFERRRELLVERRRNLELRAGIRQAAERLRLATGAEEIWEVVRETGLGVLGASTVALHLSDARGIVRFEHGRATPAPFRSRFSLLGERPDPSQLELGWADGRTSIDRDTEVAVELLCDRIAVALARRVLAPAARPVSRSRPRRLAAGRESREMPT
jgi:UDP-GlcNAc:undecaprenyl-phosphate GlcNAc-1-phosphate transferase